LAATTLNYIIFKKVENFTKRQKILKTIESSKMKIVEMKISK